VRDNLEHAFLHKSIGLGKKMSIRVGKMEKDEEMGH